MSRSLFESMSIRGFTTDQLQHLADSQVGGHGQETLEEGAISFNATTGHLVKWDGVSAWVPMPATDGYTILDSGFWIKKADLSGPYVFDGTTMKLAAHV